MHLSYANVMATIAVFIALGGGAYAAVKLPKNSVGTAQLKKHAVTPSRIALKTVALFKGQKGDRGPAGAGAATSVIARSTTGSVPATCTPSGSNQYSCSGSGTVRAACNPGEKATGGGYENTNGSVSSTGPDPSTGIPTGWFETVSVGGLFPSSYSSFPVTVYVVCETSK